MPAQLQLKVRLDAFDVRNFGPDRHGIETPDSVSDRGLRGHPTANGYSPYGLLVVVCSMSLAGSPVRAAVSAAYSRRDNVGKTFGAPEAKVKRISFENLLSPAHVERCSFLFPHSKLLQLRY